MLFSSQEEWRGTEAVVVPRDSAGAHLPRSTSLPQEAATTPRTSTAAQHFNYN